MKLTPKQTKVAILAELAQGATATSLAAKYEVNKMTISSWKRKSDKDAAKQEVLGVANTVKPEILKVVTDELKDKAQKAGMPKKQYERFDTQLTNLAEGATSLQLLDTAFHTSMMNMLTWANDRLDDDLKIGEWTMLVNGISAMHTSLFSKGAVSNINIMQGMNSSSSAKVEKFKGSFRV